MGVESSISSQPLKSNPQDVPMRLETVDSSKPAPFKFFGPYSHDLKKTLSLCHHNAEIICVDVFVRSSVVNTGIPKIPDADVVFTTQLSLNSKTRHFYRSIQKVRSLSSFWHKCERLVS